MNRIAFSPGWQPSVNALELPGHQLVPLSEAAEDICLLLLAEDDLQDFLSGSQRLLNRAEFLWVVYRGSVVSWVNACDRQPFQLMFQFIDEVEPHILQSVLERLIHQYDTIDESVRLKQELERYREDIERVNRIGIALSAERDIDTLLNRILTESRRLTRADSGSIYVVLKPEGRKRELLFKTAQNDSVQIALNEFVIPLDRSSIAGYVAVTGNVLNFEDVYQLTPESGFEFNHDFDNKHGYRTRSMLVIPMRDHKDRIIGVVQLINSLSDTTESGLGAANYIDRIRPFTRHHEQFILSLASQAAVALENNQLYQDIERLFEGFVLASVQAIESRDPTTSGHSQRVSQLSTRLAEEVGRAHQGFFRNVDFTQEQLKELRYASLLHDFGKVGVREEVLIKANKLFPEEFIRLENRFHYLFKSLELEFERQRNQLLRNLPRDEWAAREQQLQQWFITEQKRYQSYWEAVTAANRPTVLDQSVSDLLQEIAREKYETPAGDHSTLLQPDELRSLSILRGSLTEEDREEINSHVTHTREFLSRIPWTPALEMVTEIASRHHEKLDGSGYTEGITRTAIPLQSRIMTVADIFDALTASDRPYKPAVPVDRALKILNLEAGDGKIEQDLVDLFIQKKIWEVLDAFQPENKK